MQNWSVDEKHLKKFPRKYKLWRLVQTLSYGSGGKRISKKQVRDNWVGISSQLDPEQREYLQFLLWGRS